MKESENDLLFIYLFIYLFIFPIIINNTPESLWPFKSFANPGPHAKCFITSVVGFVFFFVYLFFYLICIS